MSLWLLLAPIIADDTDIVDELLFLFELCICFFSSWAAAVVRRPFPPLKFVEFKPWEEGSRSKEFEVAAAIVLFTDDFCLFCVVCCWFEKSELSFRFGTLILEP